MLHFSRITQYILFIPSTIDRTKDRVTGLTLTKSPCEMIAQTMFLLLSSMTRVNYTRNTNNITGRAKAMSGSWSLFTYSAGYEDE